MTQLSAQQVAGYAAGAGFTGTALTWAVAVALAESGGNSAAQHTNTNGSTDRGLWQINSRAHPEVSAGQAFDPAQAARAAFTISKGGTSWTPWTTAKTGAANAMMGTAALAAAHPIMPGTAGTTTAEDAANPFTAAAGSLDGIATAGKALASLAGDAASGAQWFSNKHNWSRIAVFAIGGAGALAGLVLLGQTGVGGPVGSATAPIGSAAAKAGAATKSVAKKTATVAAAALVAPK